MKKIHPYPIKKKKRKILFYYYVIISISWKPMPLAHLNVVVIGSSLFKKKKNYFYFILWSKLSKIDETRLENLEDFSLHNIHI